MSAAVSAAPAAGRLPRRRRLSRQRRLRPLWTLATAGILVVYLFPVYWMISASFQPGVTEVNATWFPSHPGVSGYSAALSSGGGAGLRTSLIIAVGSVVVTLLVSVPAAYALSQLRSRAVGVALILILVAQMIPSIVLANAFYTMFNGWGLLNSYLGLIIANATSAVPFAIVLLRSFMLRMDHDVVEAAAIDGLGPVGVLIRIVVPLSRNSVITTAVFAFLFAWGDLLFGLTLTTHTQLQPVTLFIYGLVGSPITSWATVMASSLMASLPALLVILAAQRYVRDGIAAGSGK